MKFTKTVANAFANKTREQLSIIRDQAIKEFSVSYEKKEELLNLAKKVIEAEEAYKEAKKALSEASGVLSFGCTCYGPERLLEQVLNNMAYSAAPNVPSIYTLVDDFLIESVSGEIDADKLIEKIISKYVV